MNFDKFAQKFTQTIAIEEYVRDNAGEFVFINDDKIEELQKCYLTILRDFNSMCESNNLEYCLIGGSLLGKVRHDGFIPWDDDFDIAMPRKDAEKLKSIFADTEFSKKYDLRGPGCKQGVEVRILKIYKKDSEWVPVFYKKNAMNKVFVDIFIIDYVPDSSFNRLIRGISNTALIGIIGCIEFKVNGVDNKKISTGIKGKLMYAVRSIVGTVFSLNSLNKWYSIFDKTSFYKRKTKNCTIATGKLFYFGEIAPADIFYPFQNADFCGVKCWVPNKPEEYLKHRYGDYKRIPSVEERETHYVRKLVVGQIDI